MEIKKSEIKKDILNEYKFKIEMHAHTSPVSPCSHITPDTMVETYSKLGYDAIVITNHFILDLFGNKTKKNAIEYYIKDYELTCEAAKKYNLSVFLGAEIRFTESINDYLIYGVDKEILETVYDYLSKGIEVFRKEVNLDKSVFIQAHPFRDGIERVDPKLLDGMETFNMHPGHNARIGIASNYVETYGLEIKTAGTDFHDMGCEGLAALRVKALPENSFQIADILKSGDYVLEIGKNAIVLP